MEKVSKDTITKLTRRAGIKDISEDCIPVIQNLLALRLSKIVQFLLILKDKDTNITVDDINKTFELGELGSL